MKKIIIKKISFSILIFGFVFGVKAQCPNTNTQFGTSSAPDTPFVLTNMTTCIYGGEYRLVNNLVSGSEYSFETCGDSDFDSQITLYDDVTGAVVGYNDDFCGSQSKVTFTSNGNPVRVLVNRYDCASESTCMTLNATLESLSAPDPCNSIVNIPCDSNTPWSVPDGPGSWDPGGPFGTPGQEFLFEFTPTLTGVHTIDVTNNNSYVDLFYKMIEGSSTCSSSDWIYLDDVWTSSSTSLDLYSGLTYLFLLDKENTDASSGTFTITCPPPCVAPSDLLVTPDINDALLSWTNSPDAADYVIEHGLTGFTQGTGTIITNANAPTNITGLTEATTYDVYVRSNCGSLTSTWEGPVSFTTLCNPVLAPISEDFSSGSLPTCWSQSGSGSGWEFPGTPGWGVSSATDHTTGTGTAFATIDFSGDDYSAVLQMPDIDVSSLSTPHLEFYMLSNNTDSPTLNNLYVEYWDGTSWLLIDHISENTVTWKSFQYDISTSTYASNLARMRFRAESSGLPDDYYNDILLDDISIKDESYGCTDAAACNYDDTATIDNGSCELPDGCTDATACNYDATASCDDGSCEFTSCAGCTDATACNYDPTATIDDGSCDLPDGCTDATACNYDATASCDDGSCEYTSCAGCTDLGACNYDASATIDDGSCEFTSCAGCTDATACNYDATATLDDSSCEFTSCAGCTDATACNYDPTATIDDGSCDLPDGCTDPAACNYAAAAICDNGSCTYPGCTDPAACNYDALADCDDASCEYISCLGCIYAAASNYDATATIDDGSCVFEVCDVTSNDQEVYDAAYAAGVASVICPEVDACPMDLNNDNLIGTSDLLELLGAFGNECLEE